MLFVDARWLSVASWPGGSAQLRAPFRRVNRYARSWNFLKIKTAKRRANDGVEPYATIRHGTSPASSILRSRFSIAPSLIAMRSACGDSPPAGFKTKGYDQARCAVNIRVARGRSPQAPCLLQHSTDRVNAAYSPIHLVDENRSAHE